MRIQPVTALMAGNSASVNAQNTQNRQSNLSPAGCDTVSFGNKVSAKYICKQGIYTHEYWADKSAAWTAAILAYAVSKLPQHEKLFTEDTEHLMYIYRTAQYMAHSNVFAAGEPQYGVSLGYLRNSLVTMQNRGINNDEVSNILGRVRNRLGELTEENGKYTMDFVFEDIDAKGLETPIRVMDQLAVMFPVKGHEITNSVVTRDLWRKLKDYENPYARNEYPVITRPMATYTDKRSGIKHSKTVTWRPIMLSDKNAVYYPFETVRMFTDKKTGETSTWVSYPYRMGYMMDSSLVMPNSRQECMQRYYCTDRTNKYERLSPKFKQAIESSIDHYNQSGYFKGSDYGSKPHPLKQQVMALLQKYNPDPIDRANSFVEANGGYFKFSNTEDALKYLADGTFPAN